jgi:hypothetical protein
MPKPKKPRFRHVLPVLAQILIVQVVLVFFTTSKAAATTIIIIIIIVIVIVPTTTMGRDQTPMPTATNAASTETKPILDEDSRPLPDSVSMDHVDHGQADVFIHNTPPTAVTQRNDFEQSNFNSYMGPDECQYLVNPNQTVFTNARRVDVTLLKLLTKLEETLCGHSKCFWIGLLMHPNPDINLSHNKNHSRPRSKPYPNGLAWNTCHQPKCLSL